MDNTKLKVLELFAGIGACSKALTNLGIEHEIVDAVEIDKYAIKSFNAVHGTNFEPQDITKWDKNVNVDLIMHGSPCQDFSAAGLQAGGDKGSGTRSSLMYETLRIVEKVKPKYVIWENVKNLLSSKHKHNFDAYIEAMKKLGYESKYQVLNAKDYGIPQNRERVFTVSVLGKNDFTFPPAVKLELFLKDILEKNVDDKYFLSDKMKKYIAADNEKWTGNNNKAIINKTVASTITTGEGSRRCDASNYLCNSVGDDFNIKEINLPGAYGRKFGSKGKIEDLNGTSSTLQAAMGCGGGNIPLVQVPPFVEKKYESFAETHGYIPEMFNPYNKMEIGDVAPTQTVQCGSATSSATVLKLDSMRIRKLSEVECWKLMGFTKEDCLKAKNAGISNSQLYKQAGNSIVVNVLEHIFKNLLEERIPNDSKK